MGWEEQKLAAGMRKEHRERRQRFEEVKKMLVEAWNHGIDGRKAAIYARITQAQYDALLAESEELRDLRAIELERPLIEAEMAVVDQIREGKLKASTWYLEKRDPRYGKAESEKPDVSVKEKEKELLDALNDMKVEDSFDFKVERLRPIVGGKDIRPSELDDGKNPKTLQKADGFAG